MKHNRPETSGASSNELGEFLSMVVVLANLPQPYLGRLGWPFNTHLDQETAPPFVVGGSIRDLLQKRLTSHRHLVDLRLARCLSPAKLMIISYHDRIFQEPDFGINYSRTQDLQSTQSPILQPQCHP